MPKKSTRHAREPGLARSSHHRSNPSTGPEVKTKHLRSVHIGVTNGKRWLSLKKRLGLSTDEDVAVYLLDLAESVARHGEKCNGSQKEKPICKERHKEETIQAESRQDDSEDEPLRRSLRKQNGSASPTPEKSSVDITEKESFSKVSEGQICAQRGPRSKHHKNKARHRKDKRKKRRHLKAVCDTSTVETAEHIAIDTELEERKISSGESDENVQDTRLVSEVDTKSNLDIGNFGIAKDGKSVTTKTEHVDSVDLLGNVNTKNDKSKCSDEISDLADGKNNSECNVHDETQFDHSITTSNEKNVTNEVETGSGADTNSEIPVSRDSEKSQEEIENSALSIRHRNSSEYDNSRNVLQDVDLSKDVEDRKSRKRRKRPRYDLEEEEENTLRDFPEDFLDEGIHKHRKRKHKHTGDHKSRKRHDVRKAPQDGLVTPEEVQNVTPLRNDPIIEKAQTDGNVDGFMTEPQRLAIKIKLCQDCNSRHLQDACPLTTPLYAIPDSITYDAWLTKHKDNLEVIKAIKSDDPMSEGYGKPVDEGCESDDDSALSERNKAKAKAQREERQLTMDVDRPLYSRDSLPDCFELKITNSDHGLGIYAKSAVPMYVKLGPLVGKPVREMDIPDDFSMRHIWEIDNNGKTSYMSTTNPLKSNWFRYIRPAETKEERSVAVITKEGELHLVTTQNIVSGMELTYWADSQSSAWTRKNKVDKTNCGGCNLNFAHPIYYRLHCCIFHDTNYSLTIRKYHCKVCGAAVLGKDNIMKHAAELHAGRGAYQCQYCKKFFLRLNYLEMHRTYGCAQNPQRSRPLCDFCGRKFCQPQKLKVHIKRMHSDMSEVLREFQCKLCLKLLGSRAALQRHMKEVHHKDVVGAATCDRCGKMFQNKSNLKIHMLTHSGVKPFKCKESGCKAAFTTKQCLQFHYKKVHGLTEEMMPKIERSVAYTFDAYSGGLVEDGGRGKTPRPTRRNSQQENSNSLPSLDDCSSESTLKVEPPNNAVHGAVMEFPNEPNVTPKYKMEHDSRISTPSLQGMSTVSATIANSLEPPVMETNVRTEVDLYSSTRLQSKGSKKWLGEFNPHTSPDVSISHLPASSVHPGVYDFGESRKSNEEKMSPNTSRTQTIMDSSKLGLSVYRRTESASASLLVEAALDAAERDIGAVSSPILEDSDRDGNLYSISSQLQSPLPPRSPNHLDSYIQQQEELISPTPTPDNRHSPPSHLHVDYHLHRPCVDYITTPRTHNIDQYLHHEDIPRVSSPNNYIHIQQEDLVSPAGTPNPRYQEVHHHHQVATDNLSSDEGDSVAQNLSLSVKEKTLQLDLSAPYKYDTLEQEFARERANFEPLVLNSAELQGLDMSARGFHHAGFGPQVQNARYHHHHHHLYEIAERQSVDLSRTGSYSISPPPPTSGPSSGSAGGQGPGSSSPSAGTPVPTVSVATAPPPPPPPPYPHNDVLRVVSLDLTPGGRHSVDLSLSRTHHLHSSASARVITSPQPAVSTTSHAVPDTVEGRILSPPPPPPLSGYNPSYPVSPAPYHPPRPGYHHYTGYY